MNSESFSSSHTWITTVKQLYQILIKTIALIKSFQKIREIIPREYSVTEIRDEMQTGELHFGDEITVVGTFSEYLPFIDLKKFFKNEKFFKNFSHTARIEPLNDVYCGSLYSLYQKDAFAKEVIPIFYGIDSRMIEHYTGEMLELNCKIKQIPMMYKEIINKNEFFLFEKEDDLFIPFGLDVLEVKPFGLVDSFQINTWLLGNLHPAPKFKFKERTCSTCMHSFTFMQIYPLEWPMKIGCSNPHLYSSDASDKIIQNTEQFLNLDKNKFPYVIFPDPFNFFELFCPNVDIFNDEQINHSHNIMKNAIYKNIETYFADGVFPGEIDRPKEAILNVDFQYDQRKKLLDQSFQSTNVPEWTCPHFEYDPDWKNELIKKGIDVEEYVKKKEKERFKIKKIKK